MDQPHHEPVESAAAISNHGAVVSVAVVMAGTLVLMSIFGETGSAQK